MGSHARHTDPAETVVAELARMGVAVTAADRQLIHTVAGIGGQSLEDLVHLMQRVWAATTGPVDIDRRPCGLCGVAERYHHHPHAGGTDLYHPEHGWHPHQPAEEVDR